MHLELHSPDPLQPDFSHQILTQLIDCLPTLRQINHIFSLPPNSMCANVLIHQHWHHPLPCHPQYYPPSLNITSFFESWGNRLDYLENHRIYPTDEKYVSLVKGNVAEHVATLLSLPSNQSVIKAAHYMTESVGYPGKKHSVEQRQTAY